MLVSVVIPSYFQLSNTVIVRYLGLYINVAIFSWKFSMRMFIDVFTIRKFRENVHL